MSKVAVVGGGIAGLTAAHRLSGKHDVVVFEREKVPGGKIRSQKLDGFVFEWGPSGFLSSAEELRSLIAEIGLTGELRPAHAVAKKRFIYWNGALHELPSRPRDALKMTILTPFGRLRALSEPFVRKGHASEGESVFGFMRRRFGRQIAERIAAPALLGISGGDATSTSVAALFPRLPAMEAEYGSILRGLVKGPRKASEMLGFAEGMQTLTDRLAQGLGNRLQSGVSVQRVEPAGNGWRLVHDGGEATFDAVVLATPAGETADFVAGFDPELATLLREIPYAPMRAVGVAFRTADVPRALDGFGFLAARDQGVRLLGAFYTSSIVPEHALPGTIYLRIFLGGSVDPEIARLATNAVRSIVLADLQKILGINAAPVAYHEIIWPAAIPQYGLGHRALVTAIEQREAMHAGFALAGNAYRGLGVGDTVRDALAVATRIGDALPVEVGQTA